MGLQGAASQARRVTDGGIRGRAGCHFAAFSGFLFGSLRVRFFFGNLWVQWVVCNFCWTCPPLARSVSCFFFAAAFVGHFPPAGTKGLISIDWRSTFGASF